MEVVGNAEGDDPCRLVLPSEDKGTVEGRTYAFEASALGSERGDVGKRKRSSIVSRSLVGGPNEHEAVRVGNRKLAKEKRVDEAEDRGIYRNAEGQRQDGDGGESRIVHQRSQTVSNVLQKGGHDFTSITTPGMVARVGAAVSGKSLEPLDDDGESDRH